MIAIEPAVYKWLPLYEIRSENGWTVFIYIYPHDARRFVIDWYARCGTQTRSGSRLWPRHPEEAAWELIEPDVEVKCDTPTSRKWWTYAHDA
jgi:hypothetical protein